MQEAHSDLEKIALQIELPDKPRFAAISDIILFLSMLILSLVCFDKGFYEKTTRILFNGLTRNLRHYSLFKKMMRM